MSDEQKEEICPGKLAGGLLPCEYLRCYGVKGDGGEKDNACPKGERHCWRCGKTEPK